MYQLTPEQQENIRKHIEGFKVFAKTDKGLEWEQDRKNRTELIQKLLSKENVVNLTEENFSKIIKTLWATDIWTNKDYLITKLLKDNTFQRLREELNELIYGTDPLEKRFDRFKGSIKGLGPSSITEILLFASPDNYCIWNDKPKNILPFLKIELLHEKVYKYQIDGSDYVKCISVLSLLRDELRKSGFEKADFIDVDFFLAFIFYEVYEKQPKQEREKKAEAKISEVHVPEVELPRIEIDKLGHTDVQGILLELGNLLGYDTYIADPSKTYKGKTLGDLSTLKEIPQFTYQRLLDTVKNIDVIWFEEEFPKFCFEIEHTTGVTLGLLRLYQIRKITDAKFLIVAPEEIISKFQTEISKDPFHQIRERYIFRSYHQLVDMFRCALTYHKLKDKFFNT
jgi:hypothetical protein